MIAGAIGGFVVGLTIGLFCSFDWTAYFQYKLRVTEIVMKYKKEVKSNE